jgi:hypothetical protein
MANCTAVAAVWTKMAVYLTTGYVIRRLVQLGITAIGNCLLDILITPLVLGQGVVSHEGMK